MNLSDVQKSVSKSPVRHYMKFKPSTGKILYWDSSKKENVSIDELSIAVVDIRVSVTGWDEKSGSAISSNLVDNSSIEELTVKAYKGTSAMATGLWGNIKDGVKLSGGNYTANLYGIAMIEGEYKIVNLQLFKSGLFAYNEFMKGRKDTEVFEKILTIKIGEKKKHGAVNYFEPKFGLIERKGDIVDLAKEADKTMQEYLKPKSPQTVQDEVKTFVEESPLEDKNDLPF